MMMYQYIVSAYDIFMYGVPELRKELNVCPYTHILKQDWHRDSTSRDHQSGEIRTLYVPVEK